MHVRVVLVQKSRHKHRMHGLALATNEAILDAGWVRGTHNGPDASEDPPASPRDPLRGMASRSPDAPFPFERACVSFSIGSGRGF